MNKPRRYRRHYHSARAWWTDRRLDGSGPVRCIIDAATQPYAVSVWYKFSYR